MAKWKKPKLADPQQFTINWSESATRPLGVADAAPSIAASQAKASIDTLPLDRMDANAAASKAVTGGEVPRSPHPGLLQVLPWDFVVTFPSPLPDAIETGTIAEEDAEPQNIRRMHDETGRQLRQVLTELDQTADLKRRGVDPRTWLKPNTQHAHDRLEKYLTEESARLDRFWRALIGVHEAKFGEEAAHAFAKAIRAQHAGVEVIAERHKQHDSVAVPPCSPKAHHNDAMLEDNGGSHGKVARDRGNRGDKAKRIIARLPVPKPLLHSVTAGHFGQDENGPVNPSPDEVREITENHAETVIELVEDLQEASRRSMTEGEIADRQKRVRQAISSYVEDFGERAGEQLLTYCRRQAEPGTDRRRHGIHRRGAEATR